VPFPRKLLNDAETIAVDLRPHPWFFAGPTALLVGSLMALTYIAGRWDGIITWIALGVVLTSLAWFAARYAAWGTTNFVVTSDRIIFRSGVIAKRGVEIPLDRVNTIFSNQTIFERMLGSGDLVIESGGERGRETFSDIPRPAVVQQEIYRQIEADQARNRSGGQAAVPAIDPVEQLARLDDLRRRGVITEAEFQSKKAQLLDRM
jgi:uncharacterized membrane protein YdbT with pleckstrin-like domain